MLVLRRKCGESLTIGDDIKIVCLGIERGQIKLGIQAPRSMSVLREELLEKAVSVDSILEEQNDLVLDYTAVKSMEQ